MTLDDNTSKAFVENNYFKQEQTSKSRKTSRIVLEAINRKRKEKSNTLCLPKTYLEF